MQQIAALYVDEKHSPYLKIEGVDCWHAARDARRYAGPWKCIAHPPCGPHGKYRHNCGHDFSLAEIAVNQVRRFGGIFEHPTGSTLAHLLLGQIDLWEGEAFIIDQHRFGHQALKPTIIYGVKIARWPQLPPPRQTRPRPLEHLSRLQRQLTPPDLANWLVEAART